MITLTGKKVAEGIAVGRLTFYKRGKKEIRRIYVEDAKKEVLRFKKACEKAVQEIKELYAEMTREIGEANAAMFEMQLMVLEDVEYIDSVNNIIMNQKFNAEYAVKEATNRFIEKYAPREASYVRGHEADVHDMAEPFDVHQGNDFDAFRTAHAAQIVAGQIDQHDMLAAFLRVCQ